MSAATDAKLVKENFDRYAYCRDNGHLRFIAKANKCDDYFAGMQWDPIIQKRLERQGKPVLTINKTLATTAAVMGEQLRNRADISFKPSNGGTEAVAHTLNKVYISVTNANKLDWKEANVADDGFITSRGFYDVRVEFDHQMRGSIVVRSLNPRNVVLDPDAEDYNPDEWKDVIITKWVTLDDIERIYGKAKAKEIKAGGTALPYDYDSVDRSHQSFGGFVMPPDNATHDDSNTARKYRLIERQHRKLRYALHFVDAATGDLRLVPENWSTARAKQVAKKVGIELVNRRVEQIRWTVTCHNTVLHDEWSPYKHFTVVPYFPFFRHGRTIGIVENILSAQDLLNKTSSQELHIVNTTANSGWKVKTGTLRNMSVEDLEDRGAETGLVVELDNVTDMEKITPNTVPSGLDRISFKADEFIKEISGVSDSARGFDRADVAAKAIQAKQAAGSINLAKPLDNLARTRHLLAERILNLIQTYYTEERIINITGNTLEAKTEQVKINEMTPEGIIVNDLTIGEYDVIVTTAPARNSHQETQFQEATRLRELGVNIPDSILLQNSSLENKAEIVANQQQTPEQQEYDRRMQELELREKEVEIQERETKAMMNRAQAELYQQRAMEVGLQNENEAVTEAGPTEPPAPKQQMDPMKVLDFQLRSKEAKERMRISNEQLQLQKRQQEDQRMDKIQERLDKKVEERRNGRKQKAESPSQRAG